MVSVLVLVARVAIGLLLIVAGVLKAHDGPNATALSIAGYRILPSVLVKLLGIALPYLEIFLGGYLVLGLFTRVAGWIASAQFVVFAIAVGSLVVRNIPADCGCFGSSVPTPPTWGHVAADVALAAIAACVAAFGPGRFAVDARLGGDETLFAEPSESS